MKVPKTPSAKAVSTAACTSAKAGIFTTFKGFAAAATFAVFILLNLTSVVMAQAPAVMIENRSKLGFAETMEQINQSVAGTGWRIITTHDMQATMQKNGKEVLPLKVIEMCNPELAYRILSRDEQREAGVFLPCRISVYEKSDGNTYISRMNSSAFAAMIGGEAAKVVNEAFAQTEKLIAPLLDTDSSMKD